MGLEANPAFARVESGWRRALRRAGWAGRAGRAVGWAGWAVGRAGRAAGRSGWAAAATQPSVQRLARSCSCREGQRGRSRCPSRLGSLPVVWGGGLLGARGLCSARAVAAPGFFPFRRVFSLRAGGHPHIPLAKGPSHLTGAAGTTQRDPHQGRAAGLELPCRAQGQLRVRLPGLPGLPGLPAPHPRPGCCPSPLPQAQPTLLLLRDP